MSKNRFRLAKPCKYYNNVYMVGVNIISQEYGDTTHYINDN